MRNHLLLLFTSLLTLLFSGALRAEEKSLGEEILALPAEGEHLSICRVVAFATELGVPLETVKTKHPGFAWETLSPNLLSLLQDRSKLYAASVAMLHDKRESPVKSDWLSGGAKMRLTDLAGSFLIYLLPTTAQEEHEQRKSAGDDETKILKVVEERTQRWLTATRDLKAEARVALWLQQSDDITHSSAVAVLLFLGQENLFPILEADLLERSRKEADSTLVLEVGAYLRQRRHLARPFWEKFVKSAKPSFLGEYGVFYCQRGQRSLLVEEGSVQRSLDDFIQGKETLEQSEELVFRSIDLPWDYHSLGIEPASMNVPIAWENLKVILQTAVRQSRGAVRTQLTKLAQGAQHAYFSVLGHADQTHLGAKQPSAWTDPVLAAVSEALSLLLREAEPDAACETAAEMAIEWTARLAPLYRTEFLDLRYSGTSKPNQKSLMLELARDFLYRDESSLQFLQASPERSLTDAFQTGTAADWDKQLAALPWSRRIMFSHAIPTDREFAKRLWLRMRQWVAWECEGAPPTGFAEGWKKHCVNASLDLAQLTFLREFVQQEAERGKFWQLTVRSSLNLPPLGLSLKWTRLPSNETSPGGVPIGASAVLRTNLQVPDERENCSIDEDWFLRKGTWQIYQANPDAKKQPALRTILETLDTRIPKDSGGRIWLDLRSFPVGQKQ